MIDRALVASGIAAVRAPRLQAIGQRRLNALADAAEAWLAVDVAELALRAGAIALEQDLQDLAQSRLPIATATPKPTEARPKGGA